MLRTRLFEDIETTLRFVLDEERLEGGPVALCHRCNCEPQLCAQAGKHAALCQHTVHLVNESFFVRSRAANVQSRIHGCLV